MPHEATPSLNIVEELEPDPLAIPQQKHSARL